MNEFAMALTEKIFKFKDLIIEDFKEIKSASSELKIKDIFLLSDKYDMPVKTTFSILEGVLLIPTGTFERLRDRGLKIGQIQKELKIGPFKDK